MTNLCCQVCRTTFWKIHEIKGHMFSEKHKKKMKEVFQKEESCGHGFPPVVMIQPHQKKYIKQPIIGLSLLTLCFSPDISIFFYLCHVCEEKCLPENIINHLNSGDHCSNYFTYTNPNVLSYSWIPSMSMRDVLRREILKEGNKAGTRRLQLLDLPKQLLEKLASCTYSKVIQSLSENDKLLKLFEAVAPKRMMLQQYQIDTTRKHPLLGMQHIVECVCVGPTERRHYLCTLCNLTFATHMVIKHVLSFDHIFGYFKAWHPSTLLSKESYTDHSAFASLILDLAKQTEKIHDAANTGLKQVQLEPAEYSAINFACYKEALKELESIRKKKEESSLVTVVTPGPKLECNPVGQCGQRLPVLVRCQGCKINFDSINQYSIHVRSETHQQVLKEYFGNEDSNFMHGGTVPHLKSFTYLKECPKSQPAIGVSLVVTCISSERREKPVCVCFACSECFSEFSAKTHLNSSKHIINTLLHLNPWRLPLGWDNFQDLASLRSAAKEEERERGLNQTVLKILDIPPWMLKDLNPPSYGKVLRTLKQQYTLLRGEVPPSETRTKLQDNQGFPLLGREFLVKFNVFDKMCQDPEPALLCTLCQRKLPFFENYAHVFGREHIRTFISCFHPGSLKPNMDLETLLDLAKQALRHHPVLNTQEIELEKPIKEPCTYKMAFFVLQSTKTRQGKGNLKPNITPKMQLFPRRSLKDTDKTHMKDDNPANSCMVENLEKKCPGSTDLPVDMKVGAEVNITQCAENMEQKVDQKRLTPREQDSVTTVKEEIKSAGGTCNSIKKEEVEMAVVSKPSHVKTESCESRHETGVQDVKNLKTSENFPCKEEEIETFISMSKESEDTRQNEWNSFVVTEAQSLPSGRQKEETEAEEEGKKTKAAEEGGKTSQESVKTEDFNVSMQKKHIKSDVTSGSPTSLHQHPDQLWQYIKTTHREPVIGLGALLECNCDQHNPIYFCECCSEKILEKDIISHVSGVNHHKMYFLQRDQIREPQCAVRALEEDNRSLCIIVCRLREEVTNIHQTRARPQQEGHLKLSVISALCEAPPSSSPSSCSVSVTPAPPPSPPRTTGFKRLPSLPGGCQGMRISHFAAWYEKHYGYGEAQVLDVDEEVYHNLLTQNFESALQTVKALKAQQDSVCEPILTSVLSTAQPVDTSLIPETQPELSFLQDNYQVMDMETEGGLEDSEENPSSITSTKTPEVAPDSSEDVKVTLRKESHFAHNTYCQIVVKSEEAASPCMSTKGTNTCIQPDSGQDSFKLEVTSDTAVKPRQKETNVKLSQDADMSDTTMTTSTKAMTAVSKRTAKAQHSAPESFEQTAAPISKLAANTSSCAAAKSGKCAASSSSVSATSFKSSTASSSKTSTTTVSVGNANSGSATREAVHRCAFVTTTTASADDNRVTSEVTKPVTRTITNTPAAAINRGLQTTSPSGILATTKSSQTTHKVSASISSHCATTKDSSATSQSSVTSTSKFPPPTNSCNANKSSSRETAYKFATSTISANATSTKPTGANPDTSTSKTTSTSKPEQVSKPVTDKTGVSTKAGVKPGVVQEASCRHPPAAISQAVVSSVSAADLPGKCGIAEKSSKTAMEKKSVGSNADVVQNDGSTALKGALIIGLNYGIKVSCGNRKQIYCRLCSSRLRRAGHFSSFRHKLNYVKMKYPSWTAKPSEMKSKLDKIVTHLAEIEKDVETKGQERFEVNLKTYNELGDPLLSEDKAYEKLMEKMRQKDSWVSSSTADPSEVWTPDTAFPNSPEVFSPEDEIVWQNETAGSENKEVLQAPRAKTPESEAISGDKRPERPAGPLDQSEQILDLKAESMAALDQQETVESNEEFRAEEQAIPEVTQSHHLSHSQPQVDKTPQSGMAPQTFISQVFNASQDAPDRTNQLEGSNLENQVSGETSPVQHSSPEKAFSAASVNTGQQNQPRPSQTVEKGPTLHEWSSRAEPHHAPRALPKIPIGDVSWGCSNLSKFLTVKRLDSEPIIGLGAVWECRGLQQKTFYLCASCSERLSNRDICKHMISDKHQLNHMLKEYSQLMEFQKMNDLQPEIKCDVFREVLIEVSRRERNLKQDAQCVPLPQDLFEYVKSAPFSEALKFLQDFKTNQRLSIICPPSSAPQQQQQQQQQRDQLPEEDQSQAGSQSTEMKPAQAPETDKTCDEVRQETEEQHLVGIIQRKVLSPPEETGVCTEEDSSDAQVPESGTCQSPKEPDSNQSEQRQPMSQSITGSQVKLTELCPPSSPSSPSSKDGQKTGPAVPVFTGDTSLLTRKRANDTSVEMFARSCMADSQFEEPLPPKRACSSLQFSTKSAPEPCSVPPAASATSLCAEDKNTEPGPKTWTPDITDLFGLVMERRSEKKMSPLKAAQPHSELSTSCATNPSVGVKLGPKSEQSSPEVPSKKKRWDLEPHLDYATHGTSLQSDTTADSREQHTQGSVDVQSMSGKMNLFKAYPISEDTGHNPEPQVTTEHVIREVSPLPINAIVTSRPDHRAWQLMANSKMQGYWAVNSTAAQSQAAHSQTAHSQAAHSQAAHSQAAHSQAAHSQAAHSLSSVQTVSHTNTQAASAGYDPTIQIGYSTNGHSLYLAPQTVGGFTTPFCPLTYTPGTYQGGSYISSRSYQSLGWMEVMQQQQQQFFQQQQLFQHQYLYPPSVSAAAASTGAYGTAYQGPSHPSSQQLTNLPQYKQVQRPNIPQQP
ncbi:uncharacterized protein LOC141802558 isoform X2 [Halichoeres trimaculatus]|uniref:uncharacterized protein LOC141802558 isoform X2 n=1 Tax=Halichoeres trimaculatus TaxID=147232 RepID=UPI003D9DEA03